MGVALFYSLVATHMQSLIFLPPKSWGLFLIACRSRPCFFLYCLEPKARRKREKRREKERESLGITNSLLVLENHSDCPFAVSNWATVVVRREGPVEWRREKKKERWKGEQGLFSSLLCPTDARKLTIFKGKREWCGMSEERDCFALLISIKMELMRCEAVLSSLSFSFSLPLSSPG